MAMFKPRTQRIEGMREKSPDGSQSVASSTPGVRMIRQNTNQRKQAMSDIEASVTKLLIATKQLLECLTQWSRLEASESDVSDIYVSLGNEFNRATISFQNAGIDMADLENTPVDLRNILERALGEEASVVNLDKFLPRIREIIINLLQGLKRKQQIHRIQSGEAAAPARMRRTESQGSQQTAASRNVDLDMSRQRSISPSIRTLTSSPAPNSVIHGPVATTAAYSSNHRQLPVLPNHNTSPSQIQSPRKAPVPPANAREIFTPAPAIIANNDPVTQLSQMTLERRSSKRFSENYLAQLTSSPNSDRSGKLSVDGVRKHLNKSVSIPETIEDDSVEHAEYSASRAYGSPPPQIGAKRNALSPVSSPTLPSPTYKQIEPPRVRQTDSSESMVSEQNAQLHRLPNTKSTTKPQETLIIFIKFQEQVKKVTLVRPITFEKLKDASVKIFGDQGTFKIYIQDDSSKVLYELEDIEDVGQRTMLSLRTDFAATASPTKESDISSLRSWLEERLATLSAEVAEVKSSSYTTLPKSIASTVVEADLLPTKVAAPTDTAREGDVDTAAYQIEIQQLKATIAESKEATQKNPVETPVIVVSANRDKVMSMSAKHEHRGTELTAKLEEAMNTMERIRKDVLQRKVTPRPQQLADLSKEFEAIAKESTALEENLVLLDAASNKLWEEELTIITTEQDALEYQRAFVDDIKADLEQSLSSLSTIKQVEEQKRSTPITSVPTMIDTTIDPSRAIKFVQADIKSLQVNHERRTAAIADAEKRRIKDREYLLENEFKNELGSFVESNALKSTGGAAEIDRRREEQDTLHRKQLFTPSNDAQSATMQAETQHETSMDNQITPQTGEQRSTEQVAMTETPTLSTNDTSGDMESLAKTTPQTDIAEGAAKHAPGEANGTARTNGNRAVSSSASILARIDAAKTMDVFDRRRSSLVVKKPAHTESLLSDTKELQKPEAIPENGNVKDNLGPEQSMSSTDETSLEGTD